KNEVRFTLFDFLQADFAILGFGDHFNSWVGLDDVLDHRAHDEGIIDNQCLLLHDFAPPSWARRVQRATMAPISSSPSICVAWPASMAADGIPGNTAGSGRVPST